MEQKDLSIPGVVGAIHGNAAVVDVQCTSTPSHVFLATSRETETPQQPADPTPWAPLTYLNDEFPSLWPYVYSTVSNSLAQFFLSFLPNDPRIRNVLWAFEPHLLRIWTVIEEPDFDLEKQIYEAEQHFLDKMDDSCDFSIIYAFGKSTDEIRPMGTTAVK